MTYNNYPVIEYDINTYIRDYYFRVVFYDNYVKNNILHFHLYNLQYGDTPEKLSMEFYGTDEFWYMILLVNNIEDPFYEWMLTDEECMNYAKKYVSEQYSSLVGDAKQDMINEIYTEVINANKTQIYIPNKNIIGFLHDEFNKMVKNKTY